MARKVLGNIDLDPASNDLAQQSIKATQYFIGLWTKANMFASIKRESKGIN